MKFEPMTDRNDKRQIGRHTFLVKLEPIWQVRCSCGWKSETMPHGSWESRALEVMEDHLIEIYLEALTPLLKDPVRENAVS